ncbi:hypothetical protein K488DRAFT_67668 [Vararia minispora EC-137]|uniref:Uncharacterized protein n=1 Tax=Vararia minispora EC-137 TaxID=1314806 RepID=A0ACB8QXG8_9AGAM|nr:hypothetical protein K488DRAFT_67668 [Vararia minispora EC-137]
MFFSLALTPVRTSPSTRPPPEPPPRCRRPSSDIPYSPRCTGHWTGTSRVPASLVHRQAPHSQAPHSPAPYRHGLASHPASHAPHCALSDPPKRFRAMKQLFRELPSFRAIWRRASVWDNATISIPKHHIDQVTAFTSAVQHVLSLDLGGVSDTPQSIMRLAETATKMKWKENATISGRRKNRNFTGPRPRGYWNRKQPVSPRLRLGIC